MKNKMLAAMAAAGALSLSGCVSQFISDMNDPDRVTSPPVPQYSSAGGASPGAVHPPPVSPPTSNVLPGPGGH
jgi:hypothetical protein